MILNTIIGTTRQLGGDSDPFVSDAFMSFAKDVLLFGGPWISTNARLQLVEIAFTALFTGAVGKLGGDAGPRLGCGDGRGNGDLLLDKVDQLGIFFGGPTGTATAPTSLRSGTRGRGGGLGGRGQLLVGRSIASSFLRHGLWRKVSSRTGT